MSFIKDIFFGGDEKEAAKIQAGAAREAGEFQLEAAREVIDMLERQQEQTRRDSAPFRHTGYQALNAQAQLLGLPGYSGPVGALPEEAEAAPAESAPYLSYLGGPFGGPFRIDNQIVPGATTTASMAPESLEPTSIDTSYGGFRASPGYSFMKDELDRALRRTSAARGDFYSGRALREAARYSAGLADQEFSDYYNRLAGISGTGQTSTSNLSRLGANTAGNAGSALLSGSSDFGSSLMSAGAANAGGVLGRSNAIKSSLFDIASIFI